MANRFWVKNGGLTNANTASAWNTAIDGSGSAGIPQTNDTVIFGHITTLAANKGNAECNWDLALSLTNFDTYSGYNTATITSNLISFSNSQFITHANQNWADLGFRVGMQIVVSGATNASNNQTVDIAAINSNVITLTQTNLTNESAGQSVTVLATIQVRLSNNITLNRLNLDTKLINASGSNKTITFSGTVPSTNRYVFNGENAVIDNQNIITYTFNTSANNTAKVFFDDGPYPIVTTAGTSFFTPEYSVPTSDEHGAATFYSMNIGSASTLQPNSSPSASSTQNASKIFEILTTSTFGIGGSVFDAGFSTFAFTMNATNWTIPVTGDTTFGTAPFKCRFYNFILRTPSTAGFKALVPNNRTLSLNSLTVEADAVLKGDSTPGSSTTSTVISVRRPLIKGSWNFSQLTDGVYVSLMSDTFPITPSDGPVGRVQLSNDGGTFTSDADLTFSSDTLHADKGIKLTEGSDHPIADAAGTGIIWVKNTAPSTLIFTNDAGTDTTLGAGGGGGITALTGEVTASGSGSVAATIANSAVVAGKLASNAVTTAKINADAVTNAKIADDAVDTENIADDAITAALIDDGAVGTAAIADDAVTDDKLANATLAKIDGALPKAGGTMTGEIEATTVTLNAVPADPGTGNKVRLGESGGSSNMLQIQTDAGYIQIGPNNSGYAHLQTAQLQFYMNRPLIVDGTNSGLYGYDNGLKLGTGTTAAGATVALTIANGSDDITVAGDIAVGGTVDGIDIATDVAANTAKVTNATHSGEVTGATALTIADNVVDEANLKVSNTPTNGYALTAQSGASGGLTWAAMSGGGSVAPITLDTTNDRVGINEASPDYALHVHSEESNYSVKFEHAQGQTLFNAFGHLLIQNDNSSPTDGANLDNPVWQIGQRDGGQFDIALGDISTQLVPASKKLLELKRVGNSSSGAPQIGFLGATAVSAQTSPGVVPTGGNADAAINADAINALVTALTNLGLMA